MSLTPDWAHESPVTLARYQDAYSRGQTAVIDVVIPILRRAEAERDHWYVVALNPQAERQRWAQETASTIAGLRAVAARNYSAAVNRALDALVSLDPMEYSRLCWLRLQDDRAFRDAMDGLGVAA